MVKLKATVYPWETSTLFDPPSIGTDRIYFKVFNNGKFYEASVRLRDLLDGESKYLDLKCEGWQMGTLKVKLINEYSYQCFIPPPPPMCPFPQPVNGYGYCQPSSNAQQLVIYPPPPPLQQQQPMYSQQGQLPNPMWYPQNQMFNPIYQQPSQSCYGYNQPFYY
ncbi:predicted protein [Naegleria gruberi]|uniref:Predicted protein n=1 Tax=Naegleria gruberi TaxID=5762 RepID=D2VWA3_NAEGR|nr:uncharacterized protein NAEGRDRAFT_73311 [Naegleria gruberi]EFC38867.1 predicted protein [Naegleria gruberi]|eukprot:XP_002671611.1 predicted protein [Naegleria gruberi strain NEG-M]